MKTLLAGLIVACFALGASARIGESLEECQTRYGALQKRRGDWCYFEKNKMQIVIEIQNGKAVAIEYRKQDGNLTDQEVKALLEINGERRTWKQPLTPEHWTTTDGRMTAILYGANLSISLAKQGDKPASLRGF